jgi:hypothetical protein
VCAAASGGDGDGGAGGSSGGAGGGGGSGGEGGEKGGDGDDEEFLDLQQAEELAAAKGVELPADYAAAASEGGLRGSVLQQYLKIAGGAGVTGALARSVPAFRDRLIADRLYFFKILAEVCIDSGEGAFSRRVLSSTSSNGCSAASSPPLNPAAAPPPCLQPAPRWRSSASAATSSGTSLSSTFLTCWSAWCWMWCW